LPDGAHVEFGMVDVTYTTKKLIPMRHRKEEITAALYKNKIR
jgi:hypothetical protein